MIRNNLSKNKSLIPNIKIESYPIGKNCMSIEPEKNFSMTDLYLVLKSYCDSLTTTPTQLMVLVNDPVENRTFYTETISIHNLSNMSLTDFSIGYNNRGEKDSEYVGHEFFEHSILVKFYSIEYEEIYPVYPGKNSILEEILSPSLSNKDEKIKNLLEKIKELEDSLAQKEKENKSNFFLIGSLFYFLIAIPTLMFIVYDFKFSFYNIIMVFILASIAPIIIGFSVLDIFNPFD